MRILNAESLSAMFVRYSNCSNLTGNIVLKNANRRRDLRRSIIMSTHSEVLNQIRTQGLVLVFNSNSRIRLSIAAERPHMMFDDILIDEEIDDDELIRILDAHEVRRTNEYYVDDLISEATERNGEWTIYFENGSKISAIRRAPDFGDFTPSQELISYINTLNFSVKGG